MFDKIANYLAEQLDIAVEDDIVDKSGAWFSYNGTRLGQGKENAKQSLRDQPAICEEIEAKIRAKLLENPEAGDSLKQAEAEAEREQGEGAPADDEA